MTNSRKACINSHFKRRLRERLGITINHELRKELTREIQHGKAVLLEKQSLTRSVFSVQLTENIKGRNPMVTVDSIVVVYDKRHHNIVTVFDETMVKNGLENGFPISDRYLVGKEQVGVDSVGISNGR